jgi:hypothetical protein
MGLDERGNEPLGSEKTREFLDLQLLKDSVLYSLYIEVVGFYEQSYEPSGYV